MVKNDSDNGSYTEFVTGTNFLAQRHLAFALPLPLPLFLYLFSSPPPSSVVQTLFIFCPIFYNLLLFLKLVFQANMRCFARSIKSG
jgi:hypothetical protein